MKQAVIDKSRIDLGVIEIGSKLQDSCVLSNSGDSDINIDTVECKNAKFKCTYVTKNIRPKLPASSTIYLGANKKIHNEDYIYYTTDQHYGIIGFTNSIGILTILMMIPKLVIVAPTNLMAVELNHDFTIEYTADYITRIDITLSSETGYKKFSNIEVAAYPTIDTRLSTSDGFVAGQTCNILIEGVDAHASASRNVIVDVVGSIAFSTPVVDMLIPLDEEFILSGTSTCSLLNLYVNDELIVEDIPVVDGFWYCTVELSSLDYSYDSSLVFKAAKNVTDAEITRYTMLDPVLYEPAVSINSVYPMVDDNILYKVPFTVEGPAEYVDAVFLYLTLDGQSPASLHYNPLFVRLLGSAPIIDGSYTIDGCLLPDDLIGENSFRFTAETGIPSCSAYLDPLNKVYASITIITPAADAKLAKDVDIACSGETNIPDGSEITATLNNEVIGTLSVLGGSITGNINIPDALIEVGQEGIIRFQYDNVFFTDVVHVDVSVDIVVSGVLDAFIFCDSDGKVKRIDNNFVEATEIFDCQTLHGFTPKIITVFKHPTDSSQDMIACVKNEGVYDSLFLYNFIGEYIATYSGWGNIRTGDIKIDATHIYWSIGLGGSSVFTVFKFLRDLTYTGLSATISGMYGGCFDMDDTYIYANFYPYHRDCRDICVAKFQKSNMGFVSKSNAQTNYSYPRCVRIFGSNIMIADGNNPLFEVANTLTGLTPTLTSYAQYINRFCIFDGKVYGIMLNTGRYIQDKLPDGTSISKYDAGFGKVIYDICHT